MTSTQHTQSSAADEYAARHAEALGLIESLRDMIEDMPEPESDGINWGHAGSMGHVNKQLRQPIPKPATTRHPIPSRVR
jgi:hypothetical protein